VLQHVIVWCSVVQCVAERCSLRVDVYRRRTVVARLYLQIVCIVLAVSCSVLAVCCSVLQYVAVGVQMFVECEW